MSRELLRELRLPFESLRTIYAGGSEVRVYRNTVTGLTEVGKRVDTFGLEGAMVVEEATRLSRIRHDHLVPVNSVAEVSGHDPLLRVIEMVMPYYELGSVTDALIRGDAFGPAAARDITVAALLGLAELHDAERMIHRDFKSPNALLTGDARLARVSDLGVAAPMADDGTVEPYANAQLFSPPEAFVRERIDRRADLYAAGLMLHELVSGPLPWDAYGALEMTQRLGRGKPAVLPRHLVAAPWVPAGLRTVIRKATQALPEKRYPTAGTMIDALARSAIVDWRPVDQDTVGSGQWVGASVNRPDREYRVTVTPGKRAGWRLTGEQQVNRWQRVLEDQIVAAPRGRDVTGFFDQMVAIATSR